MSISIIVGDCRTILPTLEAQSVQCVVTSPPYFGLRDYGVEGQIGLEASPDLFIAEMVAVFREVRRVLRDDGICFINLGDSYWNGGGEKRDHGHGFVDGGKTKLLAAKGSMLQAKCSAPGLKPKDLLMMPARVAIALQADGWWLRSDIIWHKPNPMPESVTDRPTTAHEHVFLLTKSAKYFYDAEAVREEAEFGRREGTNWKRVRESDPNDKRREETSTVRGADPSSGRNLRNVWTIATEAFPSAHFATYPTELAERCIKAGSKPGDTILDPFSGAGTTALVADRLNRRAIGIELNPTYADMARNRVTDDAPLFAEVS